MILLRLCLCFPLAVLTQLGSAATQGETPSFARVAAESFGIWDRNQDGVLTPEEVDRAVLNPAYHGDQAAALAALHLWLSSAKTAPPLTKAWFAAYRPVRFTPPKGEDKREAKRARKAYLATPESLQSSYARARRRLKAGPADLYEAGGPRIEDVRQGALGDCFMLAPLGAIVHRDPETVRHMIRPSGEGYTVAFGDGQTVTVAPPTDAERAMGGASTAGGLWVRIVEKAFGSRKFEAGGSETQVARTALRGGNSGRAGFSFTGHSFSRIDLIGDFRKQTSDAALMPNLAAVRSALAKALLERRIVLAGTPNEGTPKSITPNHAYAVFAFDPQADTITLWNPHGDDFVPEGPSGFENGFRREDGVFTMPLSAFARAFSRISFEGYAK